MTDQTKPEKVVWRSTRIATEKAAFNKKNGSFHQHIGLKFKEEISEVLHLVYRFVWGWKLDTSESGSEIPGKFWNVVLEKDGGIVW